MLIFVVEAFIKAAIVSNGIPRLFSCVLGSCIRRVGKFVDKRRQLIRFSAETVGEYIEQSDDLRGLKTNN